MPTDFSPDLSRSASPLVSDVELRRILLLLERGFHKIVVTHPTGEVIWFSDSTERDASSLSAPKWIKQFQARAESANRASFAELISKAPLEAESEDRESSPACVPYATFDIELQTGRTLVLGVTSPRIGPPTTASSIQDPQTVALAPIFDTWRAGILALDGLGGVIYANSAAAQLLKVDRLDLVNRPIAFLALRSHELAKGLIELSSMAPDPNREPESIPVAIELEDGRVSHMQLLCEGEIR